MEVVYPPNAHTALELLNSGAARLTIEPPLHLSEWRLEGDDRYWKVVATITATTAAGETIEREVWGMEGVHLPTVHSLGQEHAASIRRNIAQHAAEIAEELRIEAGIV